MNLKITCNTNPDIPGEWNQADVEKEMKEFDMEVTEGDEWLEYILGHVFDEVVLPPGVYDALMSEDVQQIIFKTNHGDIVKCTKTRGSKHA